MYKTVQILKESDLIQELNLEKEQTRFDPNMEPHAHLVCLQCKSINNCTDSMISEIVDRMSNKADFSAGEWNFDIFGICSNCRQKKVYVTYSVYNIVSIIYTTTNTVIAMILVEIFPYGVTLTLNGKKFM